VAPGRADDDRHQADGVPSRADDGPAAGGRGLRQLGRGSTRRTWSTAWSGGRASADRRGSGIDDDDEAERLARSLELQDEAARSCDYRLAVPDDHDDQPLPAVASSFDRRSGSETCRLGLRERRAKHQRPCRTDERQPPKSRSESKRPS
jgi:hypothetical protein